MKGNFFSLYHFYFNPLVNIEVDVAAAGEREVEIDNKIIVFTLLSFTAAARKMLNQPKNVFSIKLFFWDFVHTFCSVEKEFFFL